MAFNGFELMSNHKLRISRQISCALDHLVPQEKTCMEYTHMHGSAIATTIIKITPSDEPITASSENKDACAASGYCSEGSKFVTYII